MKQGQFQQQREAQLQHLSPQQYLVTKLVQLPLTDLEQRVRDELYENVALEEGHSREGDDEDRYDDPQEDGQQDEEFDPAEGGDTPDDMSAALGDDAYSDDDLPVYTANRSDATNAEIPIGDTRSFIEDLEAQIADYDVSEHQRELITYLIGSLDDRGFVERPLRNIADDLLFNHNIDTNAQELEDALHILQQFDPAGIGARNLQECLLIQVERQRENLESSVLHAAANPDGATDRARALLDLEQRVLHDHFSLFERNEQERLAQELGVSIGRVHAAIAAIGRLNPHPGRSLHEAADDRAQTIVPDFIVETDHESSISFALNTGEVPPLRVSSDYLQQLRSYQQQSDKMSRSQREAFVYTKQKVESAQMFISAIRQRQHTLSATMKAIIAFQRDFILTQDDTTLRPLRLGDVAERAGVDISTVSRVVNSKYVLLDGTLYPLKYFFLRTRANADGKTILRTKVVPLLRDIIDSEDKRNPLNDEQISVLMRERGEAISRRTVAKYRDALNIPVANLRKEF